MEIEESERKFRKIPPENEPSNQLEEFSTILSQEREELKDLINKNFNNSYYVLEACLSVKAQSFISDVTLPFCLILLGQPSSYKSTILYIVGSLPDCYKTDSFTPKSFVSHSASKTKGDLLAVDLLPKIKNKTLIIPELAPIFSSREDILNEIIGIMTRVLDGKGFKTNSGVHGERGYEGDFYFTWIGAVVEIGRHVWSTFGKLGPKMYFLRIPSDPASEEEKRKKMIANLRSRSYNTRLEEAIMKVRSFWTRLETFPHKIDGKIVWAETRDDSDTVVKIAMLSQVLARLRASVLMYETAGIGGSNYNFESPIIENPDRAFNSLYNLARGHAIIYGRNFITNEDLAIVILITLSSASKERVELFRWLIENDGRLNTHQFMEKAKVSRATALKNMQELFVLGLVKKIEEPSATKPIVAIELNEDYGWFLSEEFRSYLDKLVISA